MNIAHLIEWTASRQGDRIAFVDGDRQMSFAEVDREANRVAHGLRRLGVQHGERVALVLRNCIDFPLASFGVTKLGAVVVPLLVTSTPAEMRGWLETAGARAVIVDRDAVEHVRASCEGLDNPPRLIIVGDDGDDSFDALRAGVPETAPDVDLTGDDLFTIRFTGGTTGLPKGVTSSHRNYVTLYTNLLLTLPITSNDIALHIHPLSHAAGQLMYGYWAAGAKQVIHPAFRLDPDALLETIESQRVTSLFIIPTVLNTLLGCSRLATADTSSLRSIIYGGAPMAFERLREGQAAFGSVFVQIYGCSESPQICTTLTIEDHQYTGDEAPSRLRSAGREVLNVEVRVVDEQGVPVATGDIGEVVVRGDHTMVGYWRNEALTQERVKNGWVYTGDMAYLDDEGYLFLVDRKNDLIITGGFNVWPTEIEDCLYEHPAVLEAVVFGVEDPKWGDAVTAAVLPRPGAQLDEAEVIAFLSERLTKYKVPKRVFIRDSPVPKSAVGKVLRRAARAEYVGH
jgi:fatty-acyl-CoA synthase/long-chain acyl-CoA synthetase